MAGVRGRDYPFCAFLDLSMVSSHLSFFVRLGDMDPEPPPPPAEPEVEYHWTEITGDFLNACKGKHATRVAPYSKGNIATVL